jgi:hypothetical protein
MAERVTQMTQAARLGACGLGHLGHLGHFVTGKKSVRLFSMRRALRNGCVYIQYIFYC